MKLPLNKEIIIADYKKGRGKFNWLLYIAIPLEIVLGIYCMYLMMNDSTIPWWGALLIWVLVLPAIGVMCYESYLGYYVTKGTFYVETDVFRKKETQYRTRDGGLRKWRWHRGQMHLYYFLKHGEYVATFDVARDKPPENYDEKTNKVDYRVEPDDVFYLVKVKKEIVAVYNSRTYELVPSLQQENLS